MASPRTTWRFVRPATLPAPVTGVVGGAVAAARGWPAPVPLVLAVASALLLTGASNGLNQLADIETDRINRPERPLPAGDLSPREARFLTAAMALAALTLAIPVNGAYLLCVALTVPITAAYSLPPLRTKRFPLLANATIATPRGLLLVLAGWAAGCGAFPSEAWVLGAASWLYVFGAASTKDFADMDGDRATGCTTLPLWLGPRSAARVVAPFLVVPFLLYPLAAALGALPRGVAPWAWLGGGLALLGLVAAGLLVRSPEPPAAGRPHPSWALMYAQLALAPIGAAVILAG